MTAGSMSDNLLPAMIKAQRTLLQSAQHTYKCPRILSACMLSGSPDPAGVLPCTAHPEIRIDHPSKH